MHLYPGAERKLGEDLLTLTKWQKAAHRAVAFLQQLSKDTLEMPAPCVERRTEKHPAQGLLALQPGSPRGVPSAPTDSTRRMERGLHSSQKNKDQKTPAKAELATVSMELQPANVGLNPNRANA